MIIVSSLELYYFAWPYFKIGQNMVDGQFLFLNQACTSQRLARARFLEIAFVREVSMCVCLSVCLPPGLLKTIHVK